MCICYCIGKVIDVALLPVHVAAIPLKFVWRSTSEAGYEVDCCTHNTKLTLRFMGRTITLGAAVGCLYFLFKSLSGTALGAKIAGLSFVATASTFPPALLVVIAAIAVITSGLLVSFLIEKFT